MIADLELRGNATSLSCDVCIIGAGAAGLTLAHELSGGPLKVVVLESGGQTAEPEPQTLSQGVVSGTRYTGHFEGRVRAVGGTTTKWGGQVLPLSPSDFAPRSWISDSGWPISYETVAPFYSRAVKLLGLDDSGFGSRLAEEIGAELPPTVSNELRPFFSKWLREPNLWVALGQRIRSAPNVTLVVHATVTTIALEDQQRAGLVVARTLDGATLTVRPRTVILATGALEVARLLLANTQNRASGLGNENDLVGRYLQDHPGGALGLVEAADDAATQRAFNVYHRSGVRYTLRFGLTPEAQKRHGVANAAANLMFFPRPGSGFVAAKEAYRDLRAGRLHMRTFSNLFRATRELPSVARAGFHFLRGRTYTPAPVVRLMGSVEQEPNRESRVTLARELDRLGVPRLDIRWRLTELTHHTARTLAETAKATLEATGIGSVMLEPWLTSGGDEWRAKLGDHYHQIGTARMHDSPRHGVVDSHCRLHSVNNVYVASSAVFPTGGHSNPTLTIIALAIRLADRLKAEIAA